MKPRTFLLILVLAVAVPIAIVELRLYLPTPEADPVRSVPAGGALVSPATGGGGAGKPVVDGGSDGATVTVEEYHLFHHRGVLRSAGRSVQPNVEFHVVTPSAQRSEWTGSDGSFAVALRPEEFPAQIHSASGQLLVVLERPRADVDVNLNLVAPVGSQLITPRALSFQRCGETALVQVIGASELPAGTDVVVRLRGGADQILHESITQLGAGDAPSNRVLGQLRIGHSETAYSGWYQVQVAWKPFSADQALVQALDSQLPDPLPGELPDGLRVGVYLGTRQEEEGQEREINDFYLQALVLCQSSRDLVLWLGAALRGETVEFSRSELEQLRSHPALAGVPELFERSSQVPLPAWRLLLDRELPTVWAPYTDAGLVPYKDKYPQRARNLALAYEHVRKLARLESRLLYRKLGIPPHAHDYTDYDFGPETEHYLTLERLDTFLLTIERDL